PSDNAADVIRVVHPDAAIDFLAVVPEGGTRGRPKHAEHRTRAVDALNGVRRLVRERLARAEAALIACARRLRPRAEVPDALSWISVRLLHAELPFLAVQVMLAGFAGEERPRQAVRAGVRLRCADVAAAVRFVQALHARP